MSKEEVIETLRNLIKIQKEEFYLLDREIEAIERILKIYEVSPLE